MKKELAEKISSTSRKVLAILLVCNMLLSFVPYLGTLNASAEEYSEAVLSGSEAVLSGSDAAAELMSEGDAEENSAPQLDTVLSDNSAVAAQNAATANNPATAANIASGTCGECTWTIDADYVLTIKPTDGVSGTLASTGSGIHEIDWGWKAYAADVTAVKVESTVYTPDSAMSLFYQLTNCKSMDLSGLNTSNTTNTSYMFTRCSSLTSLDVRGLDVSKVTATKAMFHGCSGLTSINLTGWDTSAVKSMNNMFAGCSSLPSLDVTGFDTSNVTDMSGMFSDCQSLPTLDVTKFDTSNVTGMYGMFYNCKNMTAVDVTGFDTSKVTDFSQMFSLCSNLTTLDVSGFDTSSATTLNTMFSSCSKLKNIDVSNFDTSKVTDFTQMFGNCSALEAVDVSGFNTQNAKWMSNMFRGCSSLTALDVSGFDTSNVTNMESMFAGCSSLTALNVSGFDTSKVTNMKSMFDGCSSLTALDVSGFDTSKVTNMSYMFHNCRSLTELNVSGFDTSNVTNMMGMFNMGSVFNDGNLSLTELDVSGFDTSKVIYMGDMFSGCRNVTKIDVSSWDTSSVTDMSGMFAGCSSLTELDLSGFDTSNVTDMSYMFAGCSSLTELDLSGFDTSNVTDMWYMFYNCRSVTELDVSGFDTSKVTNTSYMFDNCSSLTELDISGWNTSNVYEMVNMFSDCGNLTEIKIGTGWKPASNYEMSSTANSFNVVDGTLYYQPYGDYIVRSVTIHDGADDIAVDLKAYPESYPYFTGDMTATIIFGEKPEDTIGELQATLTTYFPVGSDLNLAYTADSKLFIDWGDGNIVPYSAADVTAGETISLYCASDITRLVCAENGLTAIDLSGCSGLEYLDCSSNNLTSLDVSNNTALKSLNAGFNTLTAIDVSANTELQSLVLESNLLTGLDISNNTALEELDCNSNLISELDTSNNPQLDTLYCSNNCLKFSTFNADLESIYDSYYVRQARVVIPAFIKVGELIDLSSEYSINGTETVYTWYDSEDDSVVAAATAENGVFSIGEEHEGKTLYCTMTNALYPELVLYTTSAEIVTAESIDAPQNLYAYTFGYTSIRMTWDAVEGAEGYEIFRCDRAGKPYNYVETVSADADETAYRNIGLSTGTTYYYKVRAYKTLTNGTRLYSDFSAYSSARPLPATPVVTAVRTSATTADISWVKIYGATGYSVYYSTEENGNYTFLANLKSGDTTTYRATGLASTTTYYYKVRAYRQMGDDMMFGSYSKPASAVGAPAVPTITARSVGYTSAKVLWEPVEGADGYAIYRCDVGGGAYSYITSVGADVTTYTNAGLSTGTTYYYKVRAYADTDGGRLYGNYSACATARPIPATPVVTVTADDANNTTISWVRIYGATGYSVYRSTEENGTYSFLAGISSGDTVSYTDKNTDGQTYYYKVRAYRQMGKDMMFGEYSKPAYVK